MDNLIAIFGILVILTFFASIGTGIVFLIMRSKSPVLLKKSFYLSAGVFICSLILMLISLNSIDDSDKENVASETNQTGIEEDSIPVFSYEEASAIADKQGNFTLPLTVEAGYTVELKKTSTLKSTAILEKKNETTYSLSGTVVPEEVTELYTLIFKKDGKVTEGNVFIDNELLNNAYGEKQLAAVKKEEKKEAIANEKSISYGMLNKSRDRYAGKSYHISKGKVLQAEEADGETHLLVNINQDEHGYWDDLVHIRYSGDTDAVENDIIEVYSTLNEKLDYDTKIGGTNSVPSMDASEIKVLSSGN